MSPTKKKAKKKAVAKKATKKAAKKVAKKKAAKKVAKKKAAKKPATQKTAKKAAAARKPAAKKTAAKKPAAKKPAANKAPARKKAAAKAPPSPAKKAEKPKAKRAAKKRPQVATAPTEPPASPLGTKYTCFQCGAKFYDLNRPEPICPKCGADQRDRPKPPRKGAAPDPLRAAVRPMAPLLEEEDERTPRSGGEVDEDLSNQLAGRASGDTADADALFDAADIEAETELEVEDD